MFCDMLIFLHLLLLNLTLFMSYDESNKYTNTNTTTWVLFNGVRKNFKKYQTGIHTTSLNLAAKMDMDRVYSYKIVCCYLDPQAAKMSSFQVIITMGN